MKPRTRQPHCRTADPVYLLQSFVRHRKYSAVGNRLRLPGELVNRTVLRTNQLPESLVYAFLQRYERLSDQALESQDRHRRNAAGFLRAISRKSTRRTEEGEPRSRGFANSAPRQQ